MEIGSFEVLNEDVMDVIVEHLSNVDVLSLNNAYPRLKDFCELMEKRVNECNIEFGLTCAIKYLNDTDLLYLDEAYPEIKENYPAVKEKVIQSVEKISWVFWTNEIAIREVEYEARDNCPNCADIVAIDPFCAQVRLCKICPKYVEDRRNLFRMKNKLYCPKCKWFCYDKWQLRLHEDRRKLSEKREKKCWVSCPLGFPTLSRKRDWGGLEDVSSIDWHGDLWYKRSKLTTWLDSET